MTLDPQVERFLAKLDAARLPAIPELTVEEARDRVVPIRTPPEPLGDVTDLHIPGPNGPLPIRVYRPQPDRPQPDAHAVDAADLRPVIVFFHGGGWVIGSIAGHDALCRILCRTSRSVIVSVDYRLAPEHKYPAAVEDAFAATAWVAEHAADWGGDTHRIIVAGDSAGGNLAAVTALLARDRGGPPLAAQLLIYPITDYMPDNPSYRDNATGYFLTSDDMTWFWNHYLNDPSEAALPTVSPLRAESLADLPPAMVLVAEYDPLRDEGLAYADRLEAAGVRVQRIACHGMIHGFIRRIDTFDRAGEVLQQLGQWVQSLPDPGT